MDPSKGNMILCIDANDLANGVVLIQNKRVVLYEFCKLKLAKLNYHVLEKELLAVIHVLKIWRHCLLKIKSKIETDHKLVNSTIVWLRTYVEIGGKERCP